MRDFYNSIAEPAHIEINSKKRAITQQDKILKYFQENPGKQLTPYQVQRALSHEFPNTPITSIRRAMTNLTWIKNSAGKLEPGPLEKTDLQKRGVYNKKNYTWRLRIKEGQLNLL